MSAELLAGRELDARIAVEVMGLSASWWSIHPADSWDGLTKETIGVTWDHTACSASARRGQVPGEIMRPDDRGDMPGLMVGGPNGKPVAHYSAEITAAFELVEKLTAAGLVVWTISEGDPFYTAACCQDQVGFHDHESRSARTLPLAICRAALQPSVLEHLRRPSSDPSPAGEQTASTSPSGKQGVSLPLESSL